MTGLTDGRHERRDDEGDDEGLERAQEQLPDVAHVHHLALRPSLAAGVPAAGEGVSSQCFCIAGTRGCYMYYRFYHCITAITSIIIITITLLGGVGKYT